MPAPERSAQLSPVHSPELTIIVPVLDEASVLPALFESLAAQQGLRTQIIVADGGSADASIAVCRDRGLEVVQTPAGRGRQMNAGAKRAAADWLLFLHADSHPQHPRQFADALAALRAGPDRRVAGHFPITFRREHPGHRLLYRIMEEKSGCGRRYTINGDQGLLIHRDWFDELGGYDESLAFLEDQRLAERIRQHGRWQCLPGRLTTSARRFESEGVRARHLLMAIIMAMHVTDMPGFFARAPGVYRHQARTGRLLLTPIFELLRQLARELGPRAAGRQWRAVGDFVLGQSWQLFFALDVALRGLLGPGRYPLTIFHDRVFAPLTHHRIGGWVTTGLVWGVTRGLLAPYYRWRERG